MLRSNSPTMTLPLSRPEDRLRLDSSNVCLRWDTEGTYWRRSYLKRGEGWQNRRECEKVDNVVRLIFWRFAGPFLVYDTDLAVLGYGSPRRFRSLGSAAGSSDLLRAFPARALGRRSAAGHRRT